MSLSGGENSLRLLASDIGPILNDALQKYDYDVRSGFYDSVGKPPPRPSMDEIGGGE